MLKRNGFLLIYFAMIVFILPIGCKYFDGDAERKELTEEELESRRNAWFDAARGEQKEIDTAKEEEVLVSEFRKNTDTGELVANPYPVYHPPKIHTLGYSSESTIKNDERIKTELNFNAAPLSDVIEVFSGMLKFNYVIEGSHTSTVTMSLNEHLTKDELWEVFRQVLNLSNAYMNHSDKLLQIRPNESMKNADYSRKNSETELGIFPLHNTNSTDMLPVISTFLSKGVAAVDVKGQNMLVVLDTKTVIEKIRSILEELDQPAGIRRYKMVVPCKNISVARLAEELAEILPVLGFPVEVNPEKPQPDMIQMQTIERLQILLVSAANKEALDEIARWMEILDRNDIGEQERMYVYDVINGTAEELVKAMSVMFYVEGDSIKADKDGTVTAGDNISSKAGGSSTSATSKRNDEKSSISVFETPIRVFSDAVHNRLLIRTTPRTYAMVKALLHRLDTIPTQVLLQILVIEVNLNDSIKFGVEFMMEGGNGDNFQNIGGIDYKDLAPGSEQYGGKYWIFNPKNPSEKYGYINALAGKTDVKVISSPQILVISHKEAEISVGDKVPIVNSEITDTASSYTSGDTPSTNLVRNIQYYDTGIILKVTPHITRGDRITLELEQTVSEALTNRTSNIDSPSIQERNLKTSMQIRNGQTIISGGIIREKRTDNLDSLPFIANIPLLRRLFGDTNYETQRTEMIILVSGTIIREETMLSELLKRYRDSVDTLIAFEHKNINRNDR